MNITVFGASGGIGSHVTALAGQRGHQVRAVYRIPPGILPAEPPGPPGRTKVLIAPDIFDPAFAAEAIRDANVVIAALGPNFTVRHNPRTAMTSPPDLHQRLARTLVTAMRGSAPRARLICVSTGSMGPADSVMGPGPRLLFRFFRTVAVPNLGRVGRDLIAMEEQLAASGLDWHAVRPVKLTDGPLTRNVRASDRVTVKPISRADVAWHILDLAEDPAPGPSAPRSSQPAKAAHPGWPHAGTQASPVRPGAAGSRPGPPVTRPPRCGGEAAPIQACPAPVDGPVLLPDCGAGFLRAGHEIGAATRPPGGARRPRARSQRRPVQSPRSVPVNASYYFRTYGCAC